MNTGRRNTMRSPFLPGTVTNPLESPFQHRPSVRYPTVVASVPSRVDTYLMRHDYFEKPPRPQVYPIGALAFGVQVHTRVRTSVRTDWPSGRFEIACADKRELVIRHTLQLMTQALDISMGMEVEVLEVCNIRHCGLGSTAAVQAAVAAATNHIFGDAIPINGLVKFLAQNYGEESEDGHHLIPMPSIGCAAAVGMLGGALLISGEAEIAAQAVLPESYKLVLGIVPVRLPNSNQDYYLFEGNYENMRILGSTWGTIKETIAQRVIEPALIAGDLDSVIACINAYTFGAFGDVLGYFDYRWRFCNWPFSDTVRALLLAMCPRGAYSNSAVFVSSGGPGLAVLTAQSEKAATAMKSLGITDIHILDIDNAGRQFENGA